MVLRLEVRVGEAKEHLLQLMPLQEVRKQLRGDGHGPGGAGNTRHKEHGTRHTTRDPITLPLPLKRHDADDENPQATTVEVPQATTSNAFLTAGHNKGRSHFYAS